MAATQIVVTEASMSREPVASGNWSVGLCDCFHNGSSLCCNIFWCSCCMAGRMHNAEFKGVPNYMHRCVAGGLVGAHLVGSGVAIGLISVGFASGLFNWIGYFAMSGYTMHQRRHIVNAHGFIEGGCASCVTSFFCLGCALCQQHTELEKRGVGPGYCCCIPVQQEQQQHQEYPVIASPQYHIATQPAYTVTQPQAIVGSPIYDSTQCAPPPPLVPQCEPAPTPVTQE